MNNKKNTWQPMHSNKENENSNSNIVNNVSTVPQKQVNHSNHGIAATNLIFYVFYYSIYDNEHHCNNYFCTIINLQLIGTMEKRESLLQVRNKILTSFELRNCICLIFVIYDCKANTTKEPVSMFDANNFNYQPIYMPSTNMQVSIPSNVVNQLSSIQQQSNPPSQNILGNYSSNAQLLSHLLYIFLRHLFVYTFINK